MIGALRGTLLHRENETTVVLDVSGVGYVVTVTPTTSAQLGEQGRTISLHIHTRVREDAITLYGFLQRESLRYFEALIATHGVGPSLAMAILSVYTPAEIQMIVFEEDATAMSKVPGVGKKTAARLLIELKSTFANDTGFTLVDLTGNDTTTQTETVPVARSEVAAALAELGYDTDEIRDVVRSLPQDEQSTETLLRLALKALAVK